MCEVCLLKFMNASENLVQIPRLELFGYGRDVVRRGYGLRCEVVQLCVRTYNSWHHLRSIIYPEGIGVDIGIFHDNVDEGLSEV